jgi:protease secretion system outer membrane protein
MKVFSTISLACFLALSGTTASALDLQQAYEAALLQDATLQAARFAAKAGHEDVPQARAQLLPSVSASFSRNNNELLTRTPNFLGTLSETNYGYPSSNSNLSLRQPIYRKYQWAQYQLSLARLNDVDATLEGELQSLSVRLATAYFDALMAQEQVVAIQVQLRAHRTRLDAAQKLFASGSGVRTDVDDAQAQLDMTLAQVLEAKQNLDLSRQKLRVMVNQPVDNLALLDAAALPLRRPDPDDLEAWVSRAENASPDMKVLKARVEMAQFEIDKAKAGHYPTLDAVAQWSRSSSDNIQSVGSSYEQHSVGLQLNVPLFSGGSVSAATRQAVANSERAAQNLEAARRDLGVRVQKEFRGVTEGILRIKALEQALRSAEQSLLSGQKSYQAGNRTILDVLGAETKKTSVTLELVQARYTYLLSQLRLRSLAGEAGAENIRAINLVLTQ